VTGLFMTRKPDLVQYPINFPDFRFVIALNGKKQYVIINYLTTK
jgi:hypothetical protein